jgi:hypothetical protein
MSRNPQAQFVLLSLREADSRPVGAVQRAAHAVTDWYAVPELAARHGVAAFVLRAAANEGISIPLAAFSTLRDITAQSRAKTMSLDLVLMQTTPKMAAAGLPVIVLKGPALSRTEYPTAALRPYDDLDIVVKEQDEEAAAALLTSSGYREMPSGIERAWQAAGEQLPETAPFHRQFRGDRNGAMFELHTDPLQLGLSPVCENDRWIRSLPLPQVPGASMLCPEDQLVHLCLHAHKHGFSRLIWLKDLDLVLRSSGYYLDWNLVLSVARREGVAGSVWYGLRLAKMLLGTPVPPQVWGSFRPVPWIRALYGLAWPAEGVGNLAGQMRRRAVQTRGAESWRGTLPSLIWMGRRRTRLRTALRVHTRSMA